MHFQNDPGMSLWINFLLKGLCQKVGSQRGLLPKPRLSPFSPLPHTHSCTSAWTSKHSLHPTHLVLPQAKTIYNSRVINPHEERPEEEACTNLEKGLEAENFSILIPKLWSRKSVEVAFRWACVRGTMNFSHLRKGNSWRRARAGLTKSIGPKAGHLLSRYDISSVKCARSIWKYYNISVQFSHSVMSNSSQPHGPQHTRPPCPSPTPGVHSNSPPLSQ